MLATGKEKYEDIRIPDEALLEAIDRGVRRGVRDARKKLIRRMSAAAAAVVLVLFFSANIPAIYSYAKEIPFIHTFVQAFRIGRGGVELGPVETGIEEDSQSVTLSFAKDGVQTSDVLSYSAAFHSAPPRLEFTFHGAEKFPFERLEKALGGFDSVADVYETVPQGENDVSFSIVLQKGYSYEMMEFSDPGSLNLRFYQDAYYAGDEWPPEQAIYIVRSEAAAYGEELEALLDLYRESDPSQVKTAEGNFILVFGEYDTEEEAASRLEDLKEKYGEKADLYLEEGKAGYAPHDES